jgi:hypothetical protein
MERLKVGRLVGDETGFYTVAEQDAPPIGIRVRAIPDGGQIAMRIDKNLEVLDIRR